MPASTIPTGYPARLAALDLLLENEETGAFLKDIISAHVARLPEKDPPLVQEIAMGVVRWRLLLDYNIRVFSKKKSGNKVLRMALRLTAYQLFFMEGVPDHAAVNIGVELIKRRIGERAAAYGNAIFKKMVRDGLKKRPGNGLHDRSVNFSHPSWLLSRWRADMGSGKLVKCLAANNRHGHPWLRVNMKKASLPGILREIRIFAPEEGPSEDLPYFQARTGMSGILKSRAFTSGMIAVQDPSSWFVCRLAGPRPGDRVLDLCCAPGGKAACLSEMTPGPLQVVCADISFERLWKISDAKVRLGHGGLLPLVMDGRRPALKVEFDMVMVDAPCTNLGVIRRRPEVKWRITPESLESLSALQSRLLAAAEPLVREGGVLVYSTCSPDREETVAVIRDFLRRHREWRLDKAGKRLPGNLVKKGFFLLYPGETEYDGFFAARLVKTGQGNSGIGECKR